MAWQSVSVEHAPGRGYRSTDAPVLEMMAVASGFLACLIMVLYIQSPEILRLYRRPEYLWCGVVALLYWLGTRMLGGAATYLQAFSVVLYGFMPQVIRTLIQIQVVMTKHGLHMQDAQTVVRSSPAFLVNFKENPVLWAFLNRFDLFLIWSLILIVIGLATASRLSKAKAAVVVFIVWCLGTLFAVGGGAMAKLRATK